MDEFRESQVRKRQNNGIPLEPQLRVVLFGLDQSVHSSVLQTSLWSGRDTWFMKFQNDIQNSHTQNHDTKTCNTEYGATISTLSSSQNRSEPACKACAAIYLTKRSIFDMEVKSSTQRHDIWREK